MNTSESSTVQSNLVLDLIRDELNLEHYYVSDKLIILAIINADTIENTILCEW